MALNARPSNRFHDAPPSVETSDPDVPAATHHSPWHATADRYPDGRERGSVHVRPPSAVIAMLCSSLSGFV
jgi:hypothetical protein